MLGQIISHYTILEKLGEGGMGVVYKAHDLKLDRFVALKFLPHSLAADPDEKERFATEARAAAALSHPNIAVLYEIDEHDGQTFLAMEHIEGRTLKSLLKQEKELPVGKVLDIAIQICEGLAAAHEKGIIHRDIKSENIMLTPKGQVKIMDFGLAKIKGAAQITKAGSTVGTAAYMSPEQIQACEVDHRSDLFSFGIVLYELLAGHTPFRSEHEAALAYSIVNEQPQNISAQRQNIPPALEEVVERCLAKDPAKRYQDAETIANDLKEIRQQISSGNVQGSMAAGKKSPGNTRKFIFAGAAVLLLAAIGIYLVFSPPRASGANGKTIAVLPFANLSGGKDDEYFSDGMTEDIITELARLSDLKVISRTSVMQYKGSTKTTREIAGELRAGVILEGSVQRAADQVRITAQLIDAATDENLWAEKYDREYKQVFTIQSEIAQNIAGALRAKLSPAEKERIAPPAAANTDAYNLLLQGRYFAQRKDRASLAKAVGLFRRGLAIDPRNARIWAELSIAYADMGDLAFMDSDSAYNAARDAAQHALSIDDNLAAAHQAMGNIKRTYDWDWTGAETDYRKALDLEPGNAAAMSDMAVLSGTLGRFDEAISLQRKAIELDPLRAQSYWYLTFHFLNAGRLEESKAAAKRVLELNPQQPYSHGLLAIALLLQGKTDSAEAAVKDEVEDEFRINIVALIDHALNRPKEARAGLEEYARRFHAGGALQVAEMYSYFGQTDSAFAWLDRAYRQHDSGISIFKGDPLFKNLEHDARYVALMKKLNLPI